ncbi:MAG: CPBP family intramembrane metalloprotease [Marinilabiliales bacterium]|nr:MAG: CPBP family intramembrane metalloprotease [Marinilabiliales bacterium]
MDTKDTTKIAQSPNTQEKQYSMVKILSIWFASAFPMFLLVFGVLPKLISAIDVNSGILYWLMMIAGLIWQFALSLIILKIDGYTLSWQQIGKRMWFQKPSHPKTGKKSYRLLWWVLPFIAFSGLLQIIHIPLPDIENIIPFFSRFPQYDLSSLATPEYKGAWWIMGLGLVTVLFNYLLGEEFLYRGILLPKMNGVFGRFDWLANGVLFGLYHLGKPQIIIGAALFSGIMFSLPSKLFKSSWMAVIIHGVQGIVILILILGIVLGLA